MRIDVQRAILLAMENNKSLIVQRMTPEISRTFEDEQHAVFDPVLSGQGSQRRTVADRLSRAGSGVESQIADTATGLIAVDKLFSTGTTIALDASTSYTDSSLYSDTFVSNRLGASVTQALLRGRDVRVNLAAVHQAQIDTQISEYELRGFMEVLVEQVETSFYDYALAQRQIGIYTDSLRLAEQQMAEAQERIRIGTLAETELAAAQAEVALRRENLITARSNLARERLKLLRLLNPSDPIDWDLEIQLEYRTVLPDTPLDPVEQHVAVALQMRPDLNQARLLIRRGELETVRTRNGLLPKLDAFVSYGKSGYARTFSDAVNELDGDSYDVEAGLVFELPAGNRAAKARHTRAVVSRQQSIKALENLIQLAQVDVRSAYVVVTSTREQITATAATREFQEEALRVETEKFRVGKSTSLLVAQVQRDLVASQIAEIRAIANYFKALVALYRLEGSLLQRRGLSAPGSEPVTLAD
ncbi:MAG TPA: TolC family protein [Sedimentisphaerales bacterium]|nr:TolC family protein [Sedimentisphaerales bacterium]HRS11377.1 TolC family protein [Sedimentisphaerales bacterium]HRV47949.1 TolC family protein [Sedimentisphaerales bacterium]